MATRLSRRSMISGLAGAAAAATLTGATGTAAMPEKSMLKGNINHSACKWCYPDLTVDQLAAEGKKMGLKAIDLLDPADFASVKKHGLVCAVANGPSTIPDGFNRIENHARLVPEFITRIKEVAAAGFPTVICFSGNRKGMDDQEGLANCAAGLKKIMATAEKEKILVVMELLNSKVNHPDYMCDHTSWGVELVKQVGSDRFKLLYDIYHMQIMEGDVIRTIRENHQYIGHYHTGGNPGRNEIDETQELYYPAIMRAIVETGFTGFVAQEFVPTRDPMTSLRQAISICDV